MPAVEPASKVRFGAFGSVELRGATGEELRTLLVQPKRLALFAYLALANPPRLHRRDSLVALFWPESTNEQARGSLRQSLHFLRQTLGADVLATRGDAEVGLRFSSLSCDVREFERALNEGRREEALGLYRGALLEGFHVSGVAPEFEQWLEGERPRLRARAVNTASQLGDEAERAGNLTLSVQRLRDLLRIESGSEAVLTRLMLLLDRIGDRAGALRAYDDFARRLATDFQAEPSAEARALAERLRSRGVTASIVSPQQAKQVAYSPAEPVALPPQAGDWREVSSFRESGSPATVVPGARTPSRRRWIFGSMVVVGAGLVLALGTIITRGERPTAGPSATGAATVLAIGAVEDRTGADSLGSARVLRDLLATDLARVPGVTVVSQGRIQELIALTESGEENRATLTRAARAAGATEVLEGELYRRAPATLRLDVRRVDVANRVIRRAYTAEGDDLFAIVARMSGQLAAEVGQPAPSPALSDLTTTSLVARGLYEEGVRAYYQSDLRGALRLFRAALSEDSTFAMAAYFGARAAGAGDAYSAQNLMAQASRMAWHATERERLIIATEWASVTNNPNLVAVAESLVARFPLEPDAQCALGTALIWSGDFAAAVPHLERAMARDSVSLARSPLPGGKGPPRCTACEALAYLALAYTSMDSGAAAERAARELVRLQPRSYIAWGLLAQKLDERGRFDEAMAALRTRQTLAQQLLTGDPPDDAFYRTVALIRAGNFTAADRLLEERVRDGSGLVRLEARWWQVISLRNQGRLSEALRVARGNSEGWSEREAQGRLAEAQVLFESGRVREATAAFEAAAAIGWPRHILPGAPDSALGLVARHHTWHVTHAATAYAAAGDTARLARLVDSAAVFGARGAYGRDRRLHHHLRGLLMLARGRREDAVTEFRRAIYSPTLGYTRTNLELGRVLMSLGRPREAIVVLAPALRGNLEASNYYVTHAELHERLAEAFEMAGEPDSARVHYGWVAKAWARGDEPFRSRAARAAKAMSSKTIQKR